VIFFLILLLRSIVEPDTLTQVYSDIWEGYQANESAFSRLMTSNDMIFVVLGISLIIWFTLLTYLFITDKKINRLEKEFLATKSKEL
jgi:Na+/alanine symporter